MQKSHLALNESAAAKKSLAVAGKKGTVFKMETVRNSAQPNMAIQNCRGILGSSLGKAVVAKNATAQVKTDKLRIGNQYQPLTGNDKS